MTRVDINDNNQSSNNLPLCHWWQHSCCPYHHDPKLYKRDEYPRRPPTFRNQRSFNQYEGNYKRIDHEPIWTTSQRIPLTPRYQNFFLGHCYTCKIFGHKAINCKINERNTYTRNMNGVNRRYGNNRGFVNESYNSFSPLMEKNIVCYKCNYLGHKVGEWGWGEHECCHQWQRGILLEDWLLSLMSTLVIGFGPQDWWRYLDMKDNVHEETKPMDG